MNDSALKLRIWNPAKFRLSEFSEKALSATYAYQVEPKDHKQSKCTSFESEYKRDYKV